MSDRLASMRRGTARAVQLPSLVRDYSTHPMFGSDRRCRNTRAALNLMLKLK
jgi:hypothetical protein